MADTPHPPEPVTVLFADISGSTLMYAVRGDEVAVFGRIVAAVMVPLAGYVKKIQPLPQALTLLSLTFLLGLVVIAFLPETKDRPLPE